MTIPDEIIEQVRDAADLVHLIGEHVELRRTGTDYRGPCPFHGGTKRNFAVIPKKQMFYCFVCHEGGDVFTFFMKRFGLDYPTAVRDVAGKVGVVIPERPTGGPDPREPLFSAVGIAAEWYAGRLREASDAAHARDYLATRGFTADAYGPLGLGFAPKGNTFLESMDKLGIDEDTLLEAGLAVRRDDGSVRPRFWGRLLFPIHDLRGRVVGFGGRVLGDGEPKYLNSPDSRVFHKGQLLYNLQHARPAIRRAERAVVVEGYFDVLRAVEAGVDHVVAPLGTALTSDQAGLLKRYAPEVVLLYDSDPAGMRASFRAADELLRAGVRVLMATPPPGEDPDSLVAAGGAEALRGVLDDAIDVFERKLQLLERKGWMGTLAGRRRALDRLLPTLRAARDPVTRDLYIDRVAATLGITPESVRRESESGPHSRTTSRRGTTDPAATGAPPAKTPERDLLCVMVHEPAWRSRIAEHLPAETSWSSAERVLFEYVAAQPAETKGRSLLGGVVGEERAVLEQLLALSWGDLDVDSLVDGAVGRIQSRAVEAAIAEIDRRFPLAPEEEKIALLKRKQMLIERRRQGNPHVWNLSNTGRSSAV